MFDLSSTGAKFVMNDASCSFTKQYKQCYASIAHTTAGKVTIHMEAVQQGKEQDWLLGYQVHDKQDNYADGFITVHVRHYKYLTVKRIDKSHIRVHNPNGKVIDPKPLKFHVNWWSHEHGGKFGGKDYVLKPGKTQVFTLEPRVRSQKNLSWDVKSASRVVVDSHNEWGRNANGTWSRISRT